MKLVTFSLLSLTATVLFAQQSSVPSYSGVNVSPTASKNSDSSSDSLLVRMRDKCDPLTFNFAIGPGTCVGNGNVTFSDFIAELTEDVRASRK